MTAPVLDTSASPSLPSILEGATNPAGITIADLIVDGSITDPDGPAVEAIAITGLDTSLGAWQYSLDSGTTWLTIQAEQINSTTNELGLLLGPTAMIRLLPFGDLSGTLSDAVTFRAWDESSGTQGQYVGITGTGVNTAFSAESDIASLGVVPVGGGASPERVDAPPTFEQSRDGNGRVLTDIGTNSDDGARAITIESDGRILVAGFTGVSGIGYYNYALTRYDSNGKLDTSFNGTGKVVTDVDGSGPHLGGAVAGEISAWATVTQPDGKILVAGYGQTGSIHDFAILRYNPSGSLDTSFNGTGKVVIDPGGYFSNFAENLALQPDGKIIFTGSNFVMRFNADGSPDMTFNDTGKVMSNNANPAASASVQSDGKIVVVGSAYTDASNSDFAVSRYNADGSVDTSFNGTGMVVTSMAVGVDRAHGLAIQTDGRIVVAGESGGNFAIARYNADGSLDTSFGGTGKIVADVGGSGSFDVGYNVLVQPDGKIILAGAGYESGFNSIAAIRYNEDGSLDTSFGGTGMVLTNLGFTGGSAGVTATLQADGKLVVAGIAPEFQSQSSLGNFAVVRYNIDGSLDHSFGGNAFNTLGGTVSYVAGGAPVALDVNVSVYDPDLGGLNGAGNYSGASLTLSRAGGADVHDLFSAGGNLSFSNGMAVLSTVTVGTVTNTGGQLSIEFNTNATQARVDEVLSDISYANSSDAPPPSVVLNYAFSDGNNGSQGSGGALVATGSMAVNISPPNSAPVLDASVHPNLPSVLQHATSPSGISVASLVVNGSITDPDGTAVEAIAITSLNASLGAWQYSLDSGATWLTIQADQVNSTTNELALLLGPTAKVRLLPFGDLYGSLDDAITFRAWDETSGTEGQYVEIAETGGDTAFSAASDTVQATILAANRAPTFGAAGAGYVLTTAASNPDSGGESIVLQPNGEMIVGGYCGDVHSSELDFLIARYMSDGSLDPSFNGNGMHLVDLLMARCSLLVLTTPTTPTTSPSCA
jgi:uncharacterized delta-60 repeat protein